MKCSFDISDFLEEMPSLSHSVVFLYFFALIAEEGFLISSCYFFLLKHQWAKGTRDSEVPRACQRWVAMNTPRSERETGRNCVTTGAWGGLEPQERSLDHGGHEGHPLKHQNKERTGRNTPATLCSLLPFPAQGSHWLDLIGSLRQGSLRTVVLQY